MGKDITATHLIWVLNYFTFETRYLLFFFLFLFVFLFKDIPFIGISPILDTFLDYKVISLDIVKMFVV